MSQAEKGPIAFRRPPETRLLPRPSESPRRGRPRSAELTPRPLLARAVPVSKIGSVWRMIGRSVALLLVLLGAGVGLAPGLVPGFTEPEERPSLHGMAHI